MLTLHSVFFLQSEVALKTDLSANGLDADCPHRLAPTATIFVSIPSFLATAGHRQPLNSCNNSCRFGCGFVCSVGLTAGLNDLRGLSPPWLFCDSVEYKQNLGRLCIGDTELKVKGWAEQITESCFSSFYQLRYSTQASQESSDSEHMPSSDLGKQPLFQNRSETILLNWNYGASIVGPNNFSNHRFQIA